MRTPAPKIVTDGAGRRGGTLYLVHVLTHATRTRLDARLVALGLSSFQSTLLSVIARDEGLSSSRLSRRFHVTPQAMGETIAMLERKGFVERRDDPADRKILHLLLTAAGVEVVAAAEKIVAEFERNLLDGFPSEDVERMREMLAAMLATLGDRPGPGGEQGAKPGAKASMIKAGMKIVQACAMLASLWLTPAFAQDRRDRARRPSEQAHVCAWLAREYAQCGVTPPVMASAVRADGSPRRQEAARDDEGPYVIARRAAPRQSIGTDRARRSGSQRHEQAARAPGSRDALARSPPSSAGPDHASGRSPLLLRLTHQLEQ